MVRLITIVVFFLVLWGSFFIPHYFALDVTNAWYAVPYLLTAIIVNMVAALCVCAAIAYED